MNTQQDDFFEDAPDRPLSREEIFNELEAALAHAYAIGPDSGAGETLGDPEMGPLLLQCHHKITPLFSAVMEVLDTGAIEDEEIAYFATGLGHMLKLMEEQWSREFVQQAANVICHYEPFHGSEWKSRTLRDLIEEHPEAADACGPLFRKYGMQRACEVTAEKMPAAERPADLATIIHLEQTDSRTRDGI